MTTWPGSLMTLTAILLQRRQPHRTLDDRHGLQRAVLGHYSPVKETRTRGSRQSCDPLYRNRSATVPEARARRDDVENADFLMEDLEKTGVGTLFSARGEPDIDGSRCCVVNLKGRRGLRPSDRRTRDGWLHPRPWHRRSHHSSSVTPVTCASKGIRGKEWPGRLFTSMAADTASPPPTSADWTRRVGRISLLRTSGGQASGGGVRTCGTPSCNGLTCEMSTAHNIVSSDIGRPPQSVPAATHVPLANFTATKPARCRNCQDRRPRHRPRLVAALSVQACCTRT